MPAPFKFYLRHMNSKTGYRATWDPGKPLTIGSVGRLDNSGIFSVFTTLEKEGIPVELRVDDTTADLDYTSSESVTITTKLSGKVPVAGSFLTEADAGFNIEFKSDRSVVFQSQGNQTDQLTNLAEIKKMILQKYKEANWDKDWLVVTELVRAKSATIIIANSSNATLDLKANANMGAPSLKLTDLSLELMVAKEKGSTLKYIAQEGLTPLYRVMGIRKPFPFGEIDVVTKGKPVTDEVEFDIQDLDDRELE
jgi:hypothetical protein